MGSKAVVLCVLLACGYSLAGVEIDSPKLEVMAPRLSLSFIPGEEITVTFETSNSTSADYKPVVKIGRKAGEYDVTIPCRTTEKLACYHVEINRIHVCEVTDLVPETVYFYVVGDEEGISGLSEEYAFKSPPPLGGFYRDTTMILYGDMGLINGGPTRKELIQWANHPTAEQNYDLVIHNGDISYADRHVKEDNGTHYVDMTQEFFREISPYARSKYYMTSPGNHEWPCDYEHYHRLAEAMPYRKSQRNRSTPDPQYFSFTYGNVHVISLSGEEDRFKDMNSEELKWLEEDLKLATELKQEGLVQWIFTHIHYPTKPAGYCSYDISYCRKPGHGELAEYFEDLLTKYDVDIHFTAHEHVYERTFPVYRNKVVMGPKDTKDAFHDPKHPVYVVMGSPGNEEVFTNKWMNPAPEWSVDSSRIIDFGFLKIDFPKTLDGNNSESHKITVSYVKSKEGDVEIMDSFTLEKSMVNSERHRLRGVFTN